MRLYSRIFFVRHACPHHPQTAPAGPNLLSLHKFVNYSLNARKRPNRLILSSNQTGQLMKPTDARETLDKLTLPNLLTGFRFVAAPVLLWLAWYGYPIEFLLLLAISFLSDVLDGWVARLTGQDSQFGAKLDSWADLVIYLTIGFGTWWLWRDIVHREDIYVYLIIACYAIPVLFSLLKFGKFTSYHTWLAKISAASIGLSLYPLFLFDIVWPFRIAVFIYLVTAIEQIAITLLLPTPTTNIKSVVQVLKRGT